MCNRAESSCSAHAVMMSAACLICKAALPERHDPQHAGSFDAMGEYTIFWPHLMQSVTAGGQGVPRAEGDSALLVREQAALE